MNRLHIEADIWSSLKTGMIGDLKLGMPMSDVNSLLGGVIPSRDDNMPGRIRTRWYEGLSVHFWNNTVIGIGANLRPEYSTPIVNWQNLPAHPCEPTEFLNQLETRGIAHRPPTITARFNAVCVTEGGVIVFGNWEATWPHYVEPEKRRRLVNAFLIGEEHIFFGPDKLG